MPDSQGRLSKEEKQKVVDWLEKFQAKRGRNLICPICGEPNWQIGDHLVAPSLLNASGGLLIGGVSYPHVLLISTPCGYTIFLNAVVVGIVNPGEKPDG